MCRSLPPTGQQQLKGGGKHKPFVKRDKKQSAHHISESPVNLSSDEEVFTLHNLTEPKIAKTDPITTQLNLNGNMVKFEVDTGCSVTIVSKTEYAKLWAAAGGTPELQDCSLTLKTYTGERVPTLGAAEVTVQFKDQTKQLPVVVVAGPVGQIMDERAGNELCSAEQHRTKTDYIARGVKAEGGRFQRGTGNVEGPPSKNIRKRRSCSKVL